MVKILTKAKKNICPPPSAPHFWELTSLVAHSLAAPVDTVNPLAARNSPCPPRRHSSRFCAQRRRTSFCGKPPIKNHTSCSEITAWVTFTPCLNLRTGDKRHESMSFSRTRTRYRHSLLTYFSGGCPCQSMHFPGTCYTDKVFH